MAFNMGEWQKIKSQIKEIVLFIYIKIEKSLIEKEI